jgi:hypothetical protein
MDTLETRLYKVMGSWWMPISWLTVLLDVKSELGRLRADNLALEKLRNDQNAAGAKREELLATNTRIATEAMKEAARLGESLRTIKETVCTALGEDSH